MSISNSIFLPGLAHTFQSLIDVNVSPYVADSIIKVNGTATGLEEASASSIVGPAVGTGTTGDIPVFTGSAPPVLADSGVNIDGSKNMTGINSITMSGSGEISSIGGLNGGATGPLDITSPNSINLNTNNSVSINPSNGSIYLNANTSTGNIDQYAASMQMISYNTISLNANNGLIIQCGPNQIQITPTDIMINSYSGVGLTISNNNHQDVWKFSGAATGGQYVMPLTNGLNGSVLTNDGFGNLSWVGGA